MVRNNIINVLNYKQGAGYLGVQAPGHILNSDVEDEGEMSIFMNFL